MGRIIFKKDVDQDILIDGLQSGKVDLTAYNSAMNDVSNQFTTLRNDMDAGDADVRAYADTLKQALIDNEIQANVDAITLINADAATSGSVDNKIKTAFDSIVNGAPEAYDTLQELLTLINSDDSDLNGLISQLNTKVDNIVGTASADWDTLGEIETSTLAIQTALQNQIDDLNSGTSDLGNSIPVYKYDDELAIDSSNNIIASLVPYGDIMSRRTTVYSVDATTGDITIQGIYSITVDANDATGKTLHIETDDDQSSFKASVEYFYRAIDNQ